MSYQLIERNTHCARKQHKCFYCGEIIFPGESYVRIKGKFEGEFQDTKTHFECNAAWELLYSTGVLLRGEGIDEGEFERGTTCEKGCQCAKHDLDKMRPVRFPHKRFTRVPLSQVRVGKYYVLKRHLIKITSGAYEVGGRLSNFWCWRPVMGDGSLGFEESGYGGTFHKVPKDVKITETIRVDRLRKKV